MIGLLLVFLSLIHPYHVSVLEIEYNDQRMALQLSQRIFIDDFEAALNKKSGKTIDLINMDKNITNPLIESYLTEKISLKIDQVKLELEYLGYEIEEDAAWAYLEITGIKNLLTLELINTVLLEIYEDQINLVHQRKEGTTQSFRLDARKVQLQLAF